MGIFKLNCNTKNEKFMACAEPQIEDDRKDLIQLKKANWSHTTKEEKNIDKN